MRKIFVLLLLLLPCVATAVVMEGDTPSISEESIFSTECPDGFIAVDEPSITISPTACLNKAAAGDAETCFTESGRATGSCIMYVPAGVSYYDASGTYEYTAPCPLTE